MKRIEITYAEALELFEDSYCTSLPYQYHNMDTEKSAQSYLRKKSREVGVPLINATWSTNGNMYIISKIDSYICKNVSEADYDAFWEAKNEYH